MKKKLFSGVMTAVLSLTVCVMVLLCGRISGAGRGRPFLHCFHGAGGRRKALLELRKEYGILSFEWRGLQ